jgi:outer membrane protein OmpA-like peptidoglycan-associated protein
LRARANDPDGGRVTINWSTTGGRVSGSGDTATFDASNVRAGSYTVTATAVDDRQGRASCTMTVKVSELLRITQGEKCGYFTHGNVRVDNCAKAILDDLAIRMTNQPELRANIIGYIDATPWETSRKALGERRAQAVASYLEEKGVAASRLTITDGGANNPIGDNKTSAGQRLNRRVEIELTVR